MQLINDKNKKRKLASVIISNQKGAKKWIKLNQFETIIGLHKKHFLYFIQEKINLT